MPDEIVYILEKLEKHGYKSYVVGGSVRDYMLLKEPHDFDIATSARPEEIEELFKENSLSNIGKKYGAIVIRVGI